MAWYVDEMDTLRKKLFEAHEEIGRLTCTLKQAYEAQPLERSSMAQSIAASIRRVDPNWVPQPRAQREPWPTKGQLTEKHEALSNSAPLRVPR